MFTPEEAPSYSRGLSINLVLFVMVMVMVGITSAYLKWLNRQHGQRRQAMGKSAVMRDTSLETAEEVERMRDNQAALRDGQARGEVGADEEDGQGEDDTKGDKSFGDVTDLNNEDFVFVY